MDRQTFAKLSVSALGLALVAGCSLSAPAPNAHESTATSSASSHGSDGASADGGASNDATAQNQDGTADASDTGAPTYPTAYQWLEAPPAGSGPVKLDAAGDETCSFELAYFVEPPDATNCAQYTITLERKGVTPGSCTGTKGFHVLTQHSYGPPAGVVRKHVTEELLAVAFNEKLSPEQGAPNALRLQQIDWVSGHDLHDGKMRINPARCERHPEECTNYTAPEPSLVPTDMNLTFAYDVILYGKGDYPGAQGQGSGFQATYVNFLATVPQPPSYADAAIRD